MSKKASIKKVPIGQIGMTKHKVTIADEIEMETKYHLEPSLSPRQLADCWLDPSERQEAADHRWLLICGGRRQTISELSIEVLKLWLNPDALKEGLISFQREEYFAWCKVKTKVLKKYNLSGLDLNPQLTQVHSFSIASREPLYDVDAHPNRVRNVLRAVKIRYPNVQFEHEGCLTSGQCPIGLQAALRKLAMETHGKEA